MLAYEYGKDYNPSTLNKLFVERNEYVQGEFLCFQSLANVFPDIEYSGDETYTKAGLAEALKDNYVILCLDNDSNPMNGTQTHFVVAIDGTYINDPVFGYCKFSDHYKELAIQRFGKYKMEKVNIADYEGQVIEFNNIAYIVVGGKKSLVPDSLTYWAFNRLRREIKGVSDAVIQAIPNGNQLEYKESPNYELFEEMRKYGIIMWD